MARRASKNEGSYNPFDSDGDSDRKNSLPAKNTGLGKAYVNPFDDDSDRKPISRRPEFDSRSVRKGFQTTQSRNPFSDDEEEKPLPSKSSHGNYKTSKEIHAHDLNESNAYHNGANHPNEGVRSRRGERFVSNVKERAASIGESAMRTAEKLKETSANGAHKISRIKKPSRSLSPEDSNPNSSPAKDFVIPNSGFQKQNQRDLLFEEEQKAKDTYSSRIDASTRRRYKNDFVDSGGLEGQSVQELESYAVYKAEETTSTVNNCLTVAENIREDASKTLVTLHQQGEQITRTHYVALDLDHDLSAGEKLLGNLGGIFSKKWKPTKTRTINGPLLTRDGSFKRRAKHMEQRSALGLAKSPKGKSSTRTYPVPLDTAHSKIEVEKAKQDDALSDLSNVLDQLKEVAIDMGSEIERQNGGIDHLGDDVTELTYRLKGGIARGRRLLGK